MKIAYISDLHLDFYILPRANWERKMTRLLEELLPFEKADVLIIAGDLSHYNSQTIFALRFFSTHFLKVFFVMGNHDYYLVSNSQATRYGKKSVQREDELQILIKDIPNVILLQQYEIVEYQGILFAGATNWYGLKTRAEQIFFDRQSNDSKLIKRYSIQDQHTLEMTMYEKLHKVDVLVTHIPPIFINSHLINNSTVCYLNRLHSIKAKHHVFGHCHEQEIYEQQGTHYYINSLGYPDEKLNQKICVFTV